MVRWVGGGTTTSPFATGLAEKRRTCPQMTRGWEGGLILGKEKIIGEVEKKTGKPIGHSEVDEQKPGRVNCIVVLVG